MFLSQPSLFLYTLTVWFLQNVWLENTFVWHCYNHENQVFIWFNISYTLYIPYILYEQMYIIANSNYCFHWRLCWFKSSFLVHLLLFVYFYFLHFNSWSWPYLLWKLVYYSNWTCNQQRSQFFQDCFVLLANWYYTAKTIKVSSREYHQ